MANASIPLTDKLFEYTSLYHLFYWHIGVLALRIGDDDLFYHINETMAHIEGAVRRLKEKN